MSKADKCSPGCLAEDRPYSHLNVVGVGYPLPPCPSLPLCSQIPRAGTSPGGEGLPLKGYLLWLPLYSFLSLLNHISGKTVSIPCLLPTSPSLFDPAATRSHQQWSPVPANWQAARALVNLTCPLCGTATSAHPPTPPATWPPFSLVPKALLSLGSKLGSASSAFRECRPLGLCPLPLLSCSTCSFGF